MRSEVCLPLVLVPLLDAPVGDLQHELQGSVGLGDGAFLIQTVQQLDELERPLHTVLVAGLGIAQKN